MSAKVIKVDRPELLTIENTHYADLIRDNSHLSGVTIIDTDKMNLFPVHAIRGRGEYARIKMESKPRVATMVSQSQNSLRWVGS